MNRMTTRNRALAIVMCIAMLVVFMPLLPAGDGTVYATATYKVSPNKFPKSVKRSSAFNKYTKHWLLIQYYLKKLQKNGGGTLVLKKGTYKVPNTLYVPSNTTIVFSKGAKVIKTNKSKGTKPASNLFVTCAYNWKGKKGKIKGYNGVKNVRFEGKPGSCIDLGYVKGAHAISAAHSQNVTITGMTFKNINGGHAVEVNGAKDTTITKCSFINGRYPDAKYYNKEAINIDSMDPNTGGFKQKWAVKDRTTVDTLTIENCTFKNLNRAIGTHQYSANGSTIIYHKRITIKNNKFENMADCAVYVKAWQDTTITGNTVRNSGFGDISPTSNTLRHAIEGGGISGFTQVYDNSFTKVKAPAAIYFVGQRNSGSNATDYPMVENTISQSDLSMMRRNKGVDTEREYGDYDAIVFYGLRGGSDCIGVTFN